MWGSRHSRLVVRAPVFYGWFVVAAGTLGVMMTLPGQTTGVSIFIDHLIADLQVTRSAISTLYLLGTIGGSLILSLVGRFVDRRGPRLAVTVIAAAFALACVWMGAVRGVAMLLVGFTLVRALGQGAQSLVSTHVVAIWFVRRRGIAIGLEGVGRALATATFPTLIEGLIEATGWRTAYMLLGASVALTILPVGSPVFRDRPERYGVAPDGGPSPKGAAAATRRCKANVFAHDFGRKHLGSIKGWVSSTLVFGSAVEPLVFALGYDLLGSYTSTLMTCALPPLGLAAVAPFLRLVRDGRVR
jgi:MFS family permease